MKLEVRTIITVGKTTEHARDFLVQALKRFEGKEVVITIETFYPTISGKQNRFLHGIFLPAVWQARRQAGEEVTQEDVRVEFKHRYGPHEPIKDGDEWLYEPKSIAKWTTKETEDAMEACRAEFAEFVQLPEPNEDLTPSN